MKRVFLILSFLLFSFPLISKDWMQIKEDLALYKDIMEFFIMDDGYYPKTNSAEELKKEILKRQYAENLNIKDPFGRFYKVNSNKNHYRISTEDGLYFIENGFEEVKVKEKAKEEIKRELILYKSTRSPGTTLYLAKQGNDILLNWTGDGVL